MIDHGPERADRFAVFRIPAYRAYLFSRAGVNVGQAIFQTTLAWEVYRLTSSPAALGVIGLVNFLTALSISLVAGAAADAFPRRLVMVVAQSIMFATSVLAVTFTLLGVERADVLYVLSALFAAGVAIESPARQAVVPSIVPRDLFTRAIGVNATVQSLAYVTGPAVAGILIAGPGVLAGFSAQLVCLLAAVVAMAMVRFDETPASGRPAMTLNLVVEGLRYISTSPLLLGAMLLDMFAVLFGGAKALLPVYAVDILHVGPEGYGLLTATLEAGAFVAALAMVTAPSPRYPGRALLISVAAFGVATMVFGLSRWLPLSLVAYFFVGLADQVSVVMRQTIIQLSIPDEVRGRVSAVSSIFITTSNQLGAVESGLLAAVTSAVFAVTSGGAACLAVVGIVATRVPQLWSTSPTR